MKILELNNDRVIISAEALGLTFFKTLWSRDKTKNKEKAYNDIAYVFYYADFNSPFFQYPPDERSKVIKQFVIGNEKFVVDKEIESAIESYKELNTTPSMRMLESVQIAISKMENYFRTVNYAEEDIDKVGKFIERLPKLVESVNQASEICRKEQVGSTKVRGNMKTSLFEDKD